MSTLGENLKAIRKKRELSAYRLSQLSGVGQSTISLLENGKRKTTNNEILNKLASALNVSINELTDDLTDDRLETNDIDTVVEFIFDDSFIELDSKLLSKEEKTFLRTEIKKSINYVRFLRMNK